MAAAGECLGLKSSDGIADRDEEEDDDLVRSVNDMAVERISTKLRIFAMPPEDTSSAPAETVAPLSIPPENTISVPPLIVVPLVLPPASTSRVTPLDTLSPVSV